MKDRTERYKQRQRAKSLLRDGAAILKRASQVNADGSWTIPKCLVKGISENIDRMIIGLPMRVKMDCTIVECLHSRGKLTSYDRVRYGRGKPIDKDPENDDRADEVESEKLPWKWNPNDPDRKDVEKVLKQRPIAPEVLRVRHILAEKERKAKQVEGKK